jgi:hypothetical protein
MMAKKRHDSSREIPEIPFAAPAGTPAGVEVMSLAELRRRVSGNTLARPQRPDFHHLLALTSGDLCARRIYVERSIAEEFTRRFTEKAAALPVGDPHDARTVVGPVINKWALSLLDRRVEEAVLMGARLLTGGVAEPPCYPPTVLTDVPEDAELAFDETFGPVVILETVEDADHAVRRANTSRYGLTAGVLTGDTHQGLDIARRLEAGIVHVNDQPVNDEPNMPFGGVRDSGWGCFGTGFAAEEFTELRWITLRGEPRDFAFRPDAADLGLRLSGRAVRDQSGRTAWRMCRAIRA